MNILYILFGIRKSDARANDSRTTARCLMEEMREKRIEYAKELIK